MSRKFMIWNTAIANGTTIYDTEEEAIEAARYKIERNPGATPTMMVMEIRKKVRAAIPVVVEDA